MARCSILAAAAALLVCFAAAPALAQTLSSGDCVVDLNVTSGPLGLGPSTLTYKTTYVTGSGKTKKLTVKSKPVSSESTEFGAVTGNLVLKFAGSSCNFTNASLNKKDPSYQNLKDGLANFAIGGFFSVDQTLALNVADFSGTTVVDKALSTNTNFTVGNSTVINLVLTGKLTPGGSRALKPTVTFPRGSISIVTTYTKTDKGNLVTSGNFTVPAAGGSVAFSALADVKRVSVCKLSLKKPKNGADAQFVLTCKVFTVQFAQVTSGDVTAAIQLKQQKGQSLTATGLLKNARRF